MDLHFNVLRVPQLGTIAEVPSAASKRVHVRKNMRLTKFGVGGCVDLICFRSTKHSLQELLDVKNNFWSQVCCFWARNMTESWEKWNMSETRWSKTYQTLSERLFGRRCTRRQTFAWLVYLVCLRSHVFRAYCNFELKKANSITLFERHPNNKQLTFVATVCFNGCQTSNVWRQNTACLAPY